MDPAAATDAWRHVVPSLEKTYIHRDKADDPFPRVPSDLVKVLEIKAGWVRIQYGPGAPCTINESRLTIESFNVCYIEIPST